MDSCVYNTAVPDKCMNNCYSNFSPCRNCWTLWGHGLRKSWLQPDWHLPNGIKSLQSGHSSCLITGDFTVYVPGRKASSLAQGSKKSAPADPQAPFNITTTQNSYKTEVYVHFIDKMCATTENTCQRKVMHAHGAKVLIGFWEN